MKFHPTLVAAMFLSMEGGRYPVTDAFALSSTGYHPSAFSTFSSPQHVHKDPSVSCANIRNIHNHYSNERTTRLQSLPKFFQQLSNPSSSPQNPKHNKSSTSTSSSTTKKSSTSQLNASKTLVKDKTSSAEKDGPDAHIYKNRIGLLQHALETKSNQVKTLERRVTLITDAIQKLQVSNRDLLHQLTVFKKTGRNQSSSDTKEEEMDEAAAGMELEHQAQLQRLELQLEQSTQAFQSKLSSKQSKYRALQLAYQSLEEQVSELESQYESSQDAITLLETKLETSELEYQGLEIASQQQLDDIALLEQELDLLQSSSSDNTVTSSTVSTRDESSKDGYGREQQWEELQQDYESLQKQLRTMENKYEQSKQSFSELNSVYQDRRNQLTSVMTSQQDQITTLEQSLTQSQKETIDMKHQWKSATKALSSLQSQWDKFQSQFAQGQTQAKIDEHNVRITNVAYQRSKEENESLKGQVLSLTSELDAARVEKEALQTLVQSLELQHKQSVSSTSQLKQREDDWKIQIEGLYRQVAKVSNQCNGLTQEGKELRQRQRLDRDEYEFQRAKEQVEWKNTLLNLKSDYEELISGFQVEIEHLTTTTTTDIPDTERVDTSAMDRGTSLDTASTWEYGDMVVDLEEEENKLTLSKRQRARQFLRKKAQGTKGWCIKSTKRFINSF